MAFDYKKEYKEFYIPKNKPSIVEIPKMNYIAVRGTGNPNEENGRLVMPVSVRLNHAIADGYLVANVFRLLEQEIKSFIK